MATTPGEIFAKPIDRPIDGVIKADDEASLRLELEEYVITAEIAHRLEQFLEAYNNYDTANGVWISGFFGSGKSHLLKMLAVLLENRKVDGSTAIDLFKDKLEGEPMLAGALRKAMSIPSKSILFNIDQKADVISKTDVDALLSVFQKVFDEMCGYYGKQPHIAQFERDLDSRGQLEGFKRAFESVSGKSWERGREQALLEKANIAKAFAEATGGHAGDATDILSQYRKDTRVSIEDFAATVKDWIDSQGPRFRLNFFVDEVGQYIADNVKLMTNLQTIAETLNTKCRGQAWLIVTAQQDMASVIGDLTAQQENDFSKIQARFRTRIPLNSADVAEVIQRRLLAKTDEGQIMLGHMHDREENNLRTLFDFADGSIRLKNFQGRDNFVSSYPFPPYQYTLFQMAIMSLSEHNTFEGRHSSVGERSMLGVFQDVAKKLADMPVGGLATFDLMFEGVRSALKSAVQQSIQIAERNLDDPFAVRVLKALFLVKYVKGFKPTVRNIGILLMSDLDADLSSERRRIEEALNTLERNTYIQRNGEAYEFLTNEEKDVEDEIKALDVDPSEIAKQLEDLVFDQVIRHRKIRYLATGNEYSFSRKLDDHLVGREYELAINVISPLSSDASSADAARMQGMSREELAVVLPADTRFLRDLTLYQKTYKFVRQARSGSQQPGRDRIVAEKGEQNSRRHKDLELRLRKLVADARLFVRGDELEISGDDPQERVTKGFQILVDKTYVNLPMLRGVAYAEADIAKMASPDNSLFKDGGTTLTEAEQEVLNSIQAQARNGVKVSVKNLVEKFGSKPYGWPTTAVLCNVASLSARGRLEARSDGSVLEGNALAKALQNSHILANILLTPQIEFTAAQIRKSKEIYKELFDLPADGGDARALGTEWAQGFAKLSSEVQSYLERRTPYPFVAALDPLNGLLREFKDKPASWFITELSKHEDELLDGKEQLLDPIRRFMGGSQKAIYDEAREFLREQDPNLTYVGSAEAAKLRATMEDPGCYRGTAIQDLKSTLYNLKSAVDLKLLEERKSVIAAADECKAKLGAVPEFKALTEDQRSSILGKIDSFKSNIQTVSSIAVLRERAGFAAAGLLRDMLAEIAQSAHSSDGETKQSGMEEIPSKTYKVDEYVSLSKLKVPWQTAYLSGESDVDGYLEAFRKTLLAEIREGRKVIV